MCVCVWVCGCRCVCAQTWTCPCAYGGQRLPPSGVFFHCSPPCFLIQNLSPNLKLAILARLTGQQATGMHRLHLPSLPVRAYRHITPYVLGIFGLARQTSYQSMSPAQNVRIVWGEGCSLPEDILYFSPNCVLPWEVPFYEQQLTLFWRCGMTAPEWTCEQHHLSGTIHMAETNKWLIPVLCKLICAIWDFRDKYAY